MKHFPAICVDNFYKDPDWVRKFALKQSYSNKEDAEGRYPGKRTSTLDVIHPKFFEDFTSKAMSIFYDYSKPVNWTISASFQLIEPYDNIKNCIRNAGWIHKDEDSVVAGIIFLTPNPDLDSGTSLYSLKENETFNDKNWLKIKTDFYQGNPDPDYNNLLIQYNNKFIKTATFNNVYNRLIMFDGDTYHGADGFYMNSEPRLTQVFFVKQINTDSGAPLIRCSKQNYL